MTDNQIVKLLFKMEGALLDAESAVEKARIDVKVTRIRLQDKIEKALKTRKETK